MKLLFASLAAAAAIGFAAPASAQSIDVRIGDGYRHHNSRPAYVVHPRQRVVVVRKQRHWNRGEHRGWRHANRPAVIIAR